MRIGVRRGGLLACAALIFGAGVMTLNEGRRAAAQDIPDGPRWSFQNLSGRPLTEVGSKRRETTLRLERQWDDFKDRILAELPTELRFGSDRHGSGPMRRTNKARFYTATLDMGGGFFFAGAVGKDWGMRKETDSDYVVRFSAGMEREVAEDAHFFIEAQQMHGVDFGGVEGMEHQVRAGFRWKW